MSVSQSVDKRQRLWQRSIRDGQKKNPCRFDPLGYKELGYNEQILSKIGHFSTRPNPVVTNHGCNEPRL
jgi:hypothetical protein